MWLDLQKAVHSLTLQRDEPSHSPARLLVQALSRESLCLARGGTTSDDSVLREVTCLCMAY